MRAKLSPKIEKAQAYGPHPSLNDSAVDPEVRLGRMAEGLSESSGITTHQLVKSLGRKLRVLPSHYGFGVTLTGL